MRVPRHCNGAIRDRTPFGFPRVMNCGRHVVGWTCVSELSGATPAPSGIRTTGSADPDDPRELRRIAERVAVDAAAHLRGLPRPWESGNGARRSPRRARRPMSSRRRTTRSRRSCATGSPHCDPATPCWGRSTAAARSARACTGWSTRSTARSTSSTGCPGTRSRWRRCATGGRSRAPSSSPPPAGCGAPALGLGATCDGRAAVGLAARRTSRCRCWAPASPTAPSGGPGRSR